MKNLSRKLATGRYLQKAVVVGTGSFPLDMLRYDSCYPSTSDAASCIHASFKLPGRRSVEVSRVVSSAAEPWTAARWNSFGWALEEVPV